MIQIDLRPEVEARLIAHAEARGMDLHSYVAQVLENTTVTEAGSVKPSPEEIDAWLHEIAQFSIHIPAMRDDHFSREMIYRDRD